MKLLKTTAVIAILFASSAVFATPIYYGNTSSADPLLPDNSKNSDKTGYFIWNDESSPLDWFIRWTADQNNGLDANPTWYGSVLFKESNLDGDSVKEITFENVEDDLMVTINGFTIAGQDAFGWTSLTNDSGGIDGINFSLTENLEIMHFSLRSSLWDLDNCDSCAGTQIYIGDGLAIPDVLITNPGGTGLYSGSQQSFEVKGPEPSTLALFGFGLAAMGFSTRRRKMA